MFGYRNGVKQEHVNEIRRLAGEGLSADEISTRMKVQKSCVESFVSKFDKQKSKIPSAVAKPPVRVEVAQEVEQEVATPKGEGETQEDGPKAENQPIKRKPGRPAKQAIQ